MKKKKTFKKMKKKDGGNNEKTVHNWSKQGIRAKIKKGGGNNEITVHKWKGREAGSYNDRERVKKITGEYPPSAGCTIS